MSRLSAAQRRVLRRVRRGRQRSVTRTVLALARRGMIAYRIGAIEITDSGRAALGDRRAAQREALAFLGDP